MPGESQKSTQNCSNDEKSPKNDSGFLSSQYEDVEYPFYDADGQLFKGKYINSSSSSSGSDQNSSESSSIPSGVRRI
jgi:hypothetical protein